MSYHWITDFDEEFGPGQGYSGPPIPLGLGGWRPAPGGYNQYADPVPWLIPIPERVILPPPAPPPPDEVEEMAHDWGHIFRQGAEALFGDGGGSITPYNPTYFADPGEIGPVERVVTGTTVAGGLGPEACEGMVWTGAAPPKGYKVVNWCGKGVLRKVRRRRRRRLLTASDKSDIAAIVGLVGKGQMASSLISRVST